MSFALKARQALSVYCHRRVIILLLLGFSSGLPLMLVFSTLSFWLRQAGIDRAAIGYFSWISLMYAIKWLWSPLVDRMALPGLTRWLKPTQLDAARPSDFSGGNSGDGPQ